MFLGRKICAPVYRDTKYTDDTYDLVRPGIISGAERFAVIGPGDQ